jgi:hypothetical protein
LSFELNGEATAVLLQRRWRTCFRNESDGGGQSPGL